MKTVLISGGTGGIGRALVEGFAAEGFRVAFGYHCNNEMATLLSRECGALPFQVDLEDEKSIENFYQSALAQLVHLDVLIHCAGMSHRGLVTDMQAGTYARLMHINLNSAFLLSKAALDHMTGRQSGSILLISSIQGLYGASCEAAYAASKAGLIGLAKSLAREYGPCGIRVNCLTPGVIDAGMMDAYAQEDKEVLRAATPLQRLGKTQDVFEAARFLTGEKAAFITGQVLGIDGGLIL